MTRVFPLRRSFSLDLAPEDSNSNFLTHSNDDSNLGPDTTPPGESPIFSLPQLHITSKSTATSILATNMTAAVHWQVDDIDDALAADFDGSLSGLGMELGTSSYNMSEALMALPNIPTLKGHHHHHHHHLHHDSHHNSNHHLASSLQSNLSSVLRHSEANDNHHTTTSAADSRHLNSNVHITTSSGNTNGGSSTIGTKTLLAHGKKNRLAYGSDDVEETSSIKRFCFGNDRSDRGGDHHNIHVLLPGNSVQQAAATQHGAATLSSHSSSGEEGHMCSDDCFNDIGSSCHIRHSNSVPDLRTSFASAQMNGNSNGQAHSANSAASSPSSSSTSTPNSLFSQMLSSNQFHSSNLNGSASLSEHLLGNDLANGYAMMQSDKNESAKFQYVLGASTSMAIKRTEETMTYLNQAQSYEIKLKKVGDLTEMKGKMLKTIIRVCFHDRRLQYMEKDLIGQWKEQRPSERILEIDVPLSYGVHDVRLDIKAINKTEFTWDPTKETGVFVRINCISTEFTPKKHGGEKGVPFRIVIETYSSDELDPSQCLHAASCQVKVFKPKGADRKHKTDREKLNKKPTLEQEKFQESYHCTIFKDCTLDTFRLYHGIAGGGTGTCNDVLIPTSSLNFESTHPLVKSMSEKSSMLPVAVKSQPKPPSPLSPALSLEKESSPFKLITSVSSGFPDLHNDNSFDLNFSNFSQSFFKFNVLSSSSSAEDVVRWLKEKRFDLHVDLFANWSGADILLLAKEELIQICGLADGIRLFNALHSKTVKSRLSIYVCLATDDIFRAIYLETLTVSEIQSKLISNLMKSKCSYLKRLCMMGPSGVKILMTDDVVKNMQDESIYSIEFTKDYTGEYQALMRPLNK